MALLPRAFANNVTAGAMLTMIQAGTGQLNPAFVVPLPAPLPLPGQASFVSTDVAEGTDYRVASGPARPAPPSTTTPGNATGGNTTTPPENTTSGNDTTSPPPTESPPAKSPGLEVPVAVAGALAVAVAVRRRR
jgi:hypothetical protein